MQSPSSLAEPPPPPDPFENHIDNLKASSGETASSLSIILPNRDTSDYTVKCAWEAIFDYLAAHSKTATLDQLNTTSSIIYKLAQSTHQLSVLDQKSLIFAEQRAQLRRAALAIHRNPGLSPAVRAEIEQSLALLA